MSRGTSGKREATKATTRAACGRPQQTMNHQPPTAVPAKLTCDGEAATHGRDKPSGKRSEGAPGADITVRFRGAPQINILGQRDLRALASKFSGSPEFPVSAPPAELCPSGGGLREEEMSNANRNQSQSRRQYHHTTQE